MFQKKLALSSREENDLSVLEFIGDLDSYNLKEKKKEILEIVNKFTKKYLLFDFSKLNFINSESISMLMQIIDVLIKRNQQLVLINAQKNVIDVLKVIGLLESVAYYKKIEDFKKHLKVNA